MEIFYMNGIIAIIATSTTSSLAVFIMICWILVQKPSINVMHSRHTVVTRLVLNLFVSDFLQSVGFMMSYNWLRINEINEGVYCDVQGFLINLGDITSGFWALIICLHTYMLVVHSYECEHIVFLAMVTIWPFNIAISGLGFYIQNGTGNSFYGNAGGSWCWISPSFANYRMGFHYGIILFNATVMIVLYTIMFSIIYRRQSLMAAQGSKRVLKSVNKKLIWYPFVYILLVCPLALQRIAATITMDPEIWTINYLIPAACIFTSAGLVNTVIYGITRNIVSVKPLLAKIRRFTTITFSPASTALGNMHTNSLRKSEEYFSATTITGGTTIDVDPMSSFISITTTREVRISYIDPPDINDMSDIITPPSPTHSADPLQ